MAGAAEGAESAAAGAGVLGKVVGGARRAVDAVAVRALNAFDYLWHGPTLAHMLERRVLGAVEVEELIERGFDYTAENDLGLTPADYAVLRNDPVLAGVLADRGARPRVEFLCERGEDAFFLELLELALQDGPCRTTLGRALLRACRNRRLSPTTLKAAIRKLHEHHCDLNFEEVAPSGRRENVVVLLAEHWGLDMWREILKYPIRRDLVPLPYLYISGALQHL